MLHRLRVQGFKSLRDVDVELGRLTLVFGPNGSGKSNLLEAAECLARFVRAGTVADALRGLRALRGDPVEAFSLGPGGIPELLKQRQVGMRFQAWFGAPEAWEFRYDVDLQLRPRTGAIGVAQEYLTPAGFRGDAGQPGAVAERPDEPPPIQEPFIARWRDDPQVRRLIEEVSGWRLVHLDPRGGMRDPQPPAQVDGVGERGETLVSFLDRLKNDPAHERYFDAIARALWAIVSGTDGLEAKLDAEQGKLNLRIQEDGVWMSSRVVSDGTLRVLALCCVAMNPYHQGLLAIEEPETGVHPKRIEEIVRLLARASKDRQVIATTHSPLLVAEVVELLRRGELSEDQVTLLACGSGPEGTRFHRVRVADLELDDPEVRAAFTGPDERAMVMAMIQQGWLDG